MSFKSSLLVLFTLSAVSLSQPPTTHIKVHINSGNPAFPFPQFQPYKNPTGILGNIGTKNPLGVSHAEMEQTMRDAYQIAMNRVEVPGGGVGGIDYLYFYSDCHCTEGDGYGMLAAVSMADKTTFDGLWLYEHDTFMHKVKRYRDGQINDPEYEYSTLPGVYHNPTDNSATDGDVDIAFALFCAYKQWGEFMGIDDAEGNPISYKQAAIEILKGLTDTLLYAKNNLNYLCGDIGIDGYVKNGDSWTELTGWASDKTRSGFPGIPEFRGPQQTYFDYSAPSYFHEWSEFLSQQDASTYAWNIKQFQRGEASSDWLMGQILEADPAMIPYIGLVSMSADNKPTFAAFNEGEDFRLAWRTILNYVWHGNPSSSWDPESHQVTSGKANTFERDISLRYARFLSDNRQSPWNNPCIEAKDKLASYWGPMVILNRYTPLGKPLGSFFLNWIPGTGSISAVAAQDYNLMADLYRYSEIEWHAIVDGDGYLTSVPMYFHGWFRMLGLLVLSGNYQPPSEFDKPIANMKVYMDINKTFAFESDTITYTIDYRNYSSHDASNTIIVDTLPNDFLFVSATGNGVFDAANHRVTWNIGTVPGFKTATGIDPTKGQFELKVKVGSATQKQYRNRATISCSNGTGWTSNEFPNNITSVMERNYLDIAKRALVIKKTASATRVKPGAGVKFTIDFENTSEAGWIDGGRPGVHFSFSQTAKDAYDASNTMRFRLFHDAQEAYIDYGNYRVSYFLYDSLITGLGSAGNDPGWILQRSIIEGIDSLTLVHELITPGEDSHGKWNQRVIVQFSDPTDPKRIPKLATIDHHLSEYRGARGRIHKGGTDPLRLVWFLNNSKWMKIDWSDDWSWDPNISQVDDEIYFPVTNDWTDLEKPDIPVNTWNPRGCATSDRTVNNILVEEWDGYTWRRVAGNGPLPGRDAINVIICDTVPQGLTFTGFDGDPPLGIAPKVNGNVITWTIPKLQIKQKGTITYTAIADGTCPETPDLDIVDRAWISADKESPVADSSLVIISCDSVPKPPVPDHIDIVLDTSSVDPKHDAQIESINIDANTVKLNLYAVVRDKNGNFMSWANASWTSSDPSIGSAASLDSMTGVVTRISSGTITVVVNQNGLKSDSVVIYVAQLPPWPIIVSSIILDTNADIIPDLLSLTLSDTFNLNQGLDSIIVNYKGNTYSIPAAKAVLQGTSISAPLAWSLEDPMPSGISNIIMTVNDGKKRDSKIFIDGVCPAIKSCLLLNNSDNSSKDTLSLKFSEPITISNLMGTTLLLIRNNSTDTIPLQVTIVDGQGISDLAKVTVSGTFRPSAEDRLRFVPGASGNTVADILGNTPHLLNRPVAIRTKPPLPKSGWYTDKNGDGTVETIYLSFNKDVDVADLDISLDWDAIGKLDHMRSPHFTNSAFDASTIVIDLPYEFTSLFPLKTSGNILSFVKFLSSSDDPQSIWIADSAAPVLKNASITPGVSFEQIDDSNDTLHVAFSEEIKITDIANPFFIQRQNQAGDTMDLKLLYVKNDSAVYIISKYQGFEFPVTGDSMWIRPGTVSDTRSVWQNHPDNHKVAVTVKLPQMKWKITMGPNPIHMKDSDAKITINIKPLGKTRGTLSVDAKITIYDALGNAIVRQADFKNPSGLSPTYSWDGRNQNGMSVGSGTYVGKISFGDGTPTQTVRIGVRR